MKQKTQIAAVAVFGLALACGIGISLSRSAEATTCSTFSAAGFSCPSEAEVKATIGSVITASFSHSATGGSVQDNTIAIALDPGSTALNTSASTTATVSTNDLAGYTLSVVDQDANTAMVNGTNNAYTIPANANIGTEGQYGWAIRVSNCGSTANKTCGGGATGSTAGSWLAMVASGASLNLASVSGGNSTVRNDTTTIQYGVRPQANQASGTYTDTIVYTVTVNE